LFFDPLLTQLKTPVSHVIGYADDLCVLHRCTYPDIAIQRSSAALGKMEQWSLQHDIRFCPNKSESIVFNWTKKPPPPHPTLQIYAKPLTRSTSTRYLGMHITSTLNWWPHIRQQTKKAKALLKRSNGALGKLWGPKPQLIKWTLDAVVTPKILYGSHVWHSLIGQQKLQDLLRPVNRLGMLAVAPCRLHTPTRGMEILLGYTPLHLKAKVKNITTKARIMIYHPDLPLAGHIQDIHESHIESGLATFPLDDIPVHMTPTLFKSYVDCPLPEDVTTPWLRISTHSPSPSADNPVILTIYTDGSKIDNRKQNLWGTGAGYAIFLGTTLQDIKSTPPLTEKCINLCHSMSVFQAEVTAIHQALLGYHEGRKNNTIPYPAAIIICSDSQAAIKALRAHAVRSQTVLQCKRLLNATTTLTPLHLSWVKAHANSLGNNYVDLLAKKGAAEQITWDTHPRNTITLTFLKRTLHNHIIDDWQKEWQGHPSCRQTKLWCPNPNLGLSRRILQLDRPTIGRLIRWVTGHNFLRRHSNIVDPITYSTTKCRLCGREEETSSHVLAECITLDYHRMEIFNVPYLDLPCQWKLKEVCTFLKEFADPLEDLAVTQKPMQILTRSSTRTIILDAVARPADPPLL